MYGHRYDVLTTYIVRHHDEQRPMFPDDHIPARNAIEVTLIAKPNDVLYVGEIETSQLSPGSKVICLYDHSVLFRLAWSTCRIRLRNQTTAS